MIAVSKLCCPVCWELLDILGNPKSKQQGRHSTLYFHALPSWLPEEALNELIGRFGSFLATELEKMIDKYQNSKKSQSPTPSQETACALSLASWDLHEAGEGPSADFHLDSSTAAENKLDGNKVDESMFTRPWHDLFGKLRRRFVR